MARVEEISEGHGVHKVVVTLARQHPVNRARMAFSLDRPEAVTAGHHLLVGNLERALTALGVADAAARTRDVADYGDGHLLHLLTVRRDDEPDVAAVAATVRRLLAP
ncbi:hypothetical protein ACLH0K_17430 [Arthrobacter sp. MPF02]|uniref:hypothetical protein n=1 Tax=Arthrobacter sp. MPF02 TaxID=3388492 RepID=UPI00398504C3